MATALTRQRSPEEDLCTGVWYKTRLHPPNGAPAEAGAVEMIQQPERERVGNQEGFDLLDKKEELSAIVRELQEFKSQQQETNRELRSQISSTQPFVNSYRKIRLRALENRRISFRPDLHKWDRDGEIVNDGNRVAHNGDIFADIDAIQHAKDIGSRELEDYRTDFLRLYNISSDVAAEKLSTRRPRIIQVFDGLADDRKANWDKYGELKATTRKLERKAKKFVEAVLEAKDLDQLEVFLGHGDFKSLDEGVCSEFLVVNARETIS